jgi:hypothetical protein
LVKRFGTNPDEHVTGDDDRSLNIADLPGTAIGTGNHDCGLHLFLPLLAFAGILQAPGSE